MKELRGSKVFLYIRHRTPMSLRIPKGIIHDDKQKLSMSITIPSQEGNFFELVKRVHSDSWRGNLKTTEAEQKQQ